MTAYSHSMHQLQKLILDYPIYLRAVPEIILGGPQTLFCPAGGRVFC